MTRLVVVARVDLIRTYLHYPSGTGSESNPNTYNRARVRKLRFWDTHTEMCIVFVGRQPFLEDVLHKIILALVLQGTGRSHVRLLHSHRHWFPTMYPTLHPISPIPRTEVDFTMRANEEV